MQTPNLKRRIVCDQIFISDTGLVVHVGANMHIPIFSADVCGHYVMNNDIFCGSLRTL
jgi:hypothetical protein